MKYKEFVRFEFSFCFCRLVYDSGSCYEPSILDIKPADIRQKFTQGIQRLAAFSLGINYPNQASAPHLILGGFKRLLALAADTDVEFEQAKTVCIHLKNNNNNNTCLLVFS